MSYSSLSPQALGRRRRWPGLSQSGGAGAMRPAGRGDMAPERAGTERPDRWVETLALPKRSGGREQRGSARRSGLLGRSLRRVARAALDARPERPLRAPAGQERKPPRSGTKGSPALRGDSSLAALAQNDKVWGNRPSHMSRKRLHEVEVANPARSVKETSEPSGAGARAPS